MLIKCSVEVLEFRTHHKTKVSPCIKYNGVKLLHYDKLGIPNGEIPTTELQLLSSTAF